MAAGDLSDEQAEAILARAIERTDRGRATLTLDDLVEIAGELGVSRHAVERAASEVLERRGLAPGGAAAATTAPPMDPVVVWKQSARVALLRHVAVYVAVNAFLLFVNLFASPQYLWFLWPLAGWGLAVTLHAIRLFVVDEERLRDRLAWRVVRRRRRRERRQLRIDPGIEAEVLREGETESDELRETPPSTPRLAAR